MARVVIDANLGVALAINLAYSDTAEQQIARWRQAEAEICVPSLWQYEVVSALRKAVVARLLSPAELSQALEELYRLGIQEAKAGIETHRLALSWAARLNQVVACDAQYLALAEQIGAEFWTADKNLAQRARKAGAHWVKWLGDK